MGWGVMLVMLLAMLGLLLLLLLLLLFKTTAWDDRIRELIVQLLMMMGLFIRMMRQELTMVMARMIS